MPNSDEFLYHFTSAGAALSIVTTRQLWATDIEHLNDRLEGTLPTRVLKWIVDNPKSHLSGLNVPPKHLAALRASLSTGRLACTTSFSEQFRSIPQFRMYCPPAGGYAIGFPRDFLQSAGLLRQCDYSNDNLLQWARAYALRFATDAATLDQDDLDADALCHRLISKCPSYIEERVTASLTYKSDEFINEREHRLIAFGLPKRYRESPEHNLIIPFSVIALPNEPVKVRLIAGPNREPNLAGRTVGTLGRAARDAGTKWSILHYFVGEFGFKA